MPEKDVPVDSFLNLLTPGYFDIFFKILVPLSSNPQIKLD